MTTTPKPTAPAVSYNHQVATTVGARISIDARAALKRIRERLDNDESEES